MKKELHLQSEKKYPLPRKNEYGAIKLQAHLDESCYHQDNSSGKEKKKSINQSINQEPKHF